MTKKKRRVFQHIMEDESYNIIKDYIPKEWVIREFNRPDYGIDIVIELFDKIDDNFAETLGEFIYVQVKSVKEVEIKNEKNFSVGNVAKGTWKEDRSEFTELDVIKFVFDTDSIFTIQSLGGSVSVLLFLVDLATKNVYFICLNDYIDKIILPKYPNYSSKETITITIPRFNNLSDSRILNNALKFYGKRGKLLSAFSKFAYQANEIAHIMGYKLFPVHSYRDEVERNITYEVSEIKTQILYFISQIEDLDIWTHSEWAVLPDAKAEILRIKSMILEEPNWKKTANNIIVLWHQLTNLCNIYEDICREWFLPKMIGLMTSYPTFPDIKKV